MTNNCKRKNHNPGKGRKSNVEPPCRPDVRPKDAGDVVRPPKGHEWHGLDLEMNTPDPGGQMLNRCRDRTRRIRGGYLASTSGRDREQETSRFRAIEQGPAARMDVGDVRHFTGFRRSATQAADPLIGRAQRRSTSRAAGWECIPIRICISALAIALAGFNRRAVFRRGL